MKVTRKATNNPRTRQKVRYSITELTAAEFETICKALGFMQEEETAAALLRGFSGLASDQDGAEQTSQSKDLNTDLERLKRILDD